MSGGASSGPSTGANSDAPDPVTALREGASPPGPGKPGRPGQEAAEKARASVGPTEIELEVSRGRSISWTIFGLILGGLLIWKVGTVGKWGGVALVAMGAFHAWNLIQTFLYPAGTIAISDHEVSLPRGLCMPRPVQVKPQDVTAVYFLRRSVPWNHAAPVLVVELGDKAMAFPRDWFASEADQRRIIHAIHPLLGNKTTVSADVAVTAGDDKPA